MQKFLALALASSATLLPSVASAQAAPDAPSPATSSDPAPSAPRDGRRNDSQELDADIIVTATRDATSLQKTPVAASVYSGAALRKNDITNLISLQSIDTSLNITHAANSPYVAIRGVASSNTSEIGNPAVSIALDGFFTNRAYTIASSLYDIQRIEILKGPQGTLFGRNSTGGIVNAISNRPDFKLGGYLTAEAGNYDLASLEGGANIPLTSTLAVRISGFTRQRRGYFHVTGPGIDFYANDEHNVSGRVQALWQPAERISFLVSYQRSHSLQNGSVGSTVPVGTPLSEVRPVFVAYAPYRQLTDSSRLRWEAQFGGLPFDATLTYSGGIDWTEYHSAIDATDLADVKTIRQFTQNEQPRTINQEIRLSTPQDRRFSVQVGAFYFSERNNPLVNTLAIESGPYNGSNFLLFDYDVTQSSKAVYGQMQFAILPTVRISLGSRYTWDTVKRVGTSYLRCDIAGIPSFAWPFAGCLGTPPILKNPVNGNERESKPAWHAGIDWQITDNNFLYAKFDTAFKAGGFNSNGVGPSVPFGPEEVKSWEIGSKNKFLGGALTLNVDVFKQEWNGYQATVPTTLLSGGTGILNIAAVNIKGAELEARGQLTSSTRANLGMTLLDGRFGKNQPPVSGPNGTGTANISNNRVPNAPPLAITAGLEQDADAFGGKVTFGVNGKYSSKFYYNIYNQPTASSPPYLILNASMDFTPSNSAWNIQLFVRNVLDRKTVAFASYNATTNTNGYEFMPPRTIAIRATTHF